MDYTVHGVLQARIQEWVAFSLLQRIFQTQGSNLGVLHYGQILYQLSHKESPRKVGSLSLLQRIFPTQESKRDLLHCMQII